MASLPISPDEHRRLVRLVTERGGMTTALQRQNTLEAAGLLERFGGRVNFDVDTATFCQMLVRELQQFGTDPATSQPALVALLGMMRERLEGWPDDRAFVETLIARAPSTAGTGASAGDTGGGTDAGTTTGRSTSAGAAGAPPSPPPPPTDTVLRVLFLAANPVDTPPLRLGEESRVIQQRLRVEAGLRDRFDIEQAHAERWEDLSLHLLAYRPHIVHFAGHGEHGGELVFETDSGRRRTVPVALVGELFEIVRATVGVRGVVLNACWSEAQARAILPHVRFVIGMARPIPDDAAIRFAAGLYRGLGFGLGIADAFKLGRNEMAAGAAGSADRGFAAPVGATGGAGEADDPGADVPLYDIPRLLLAPGVDGGAGGGVI